MKLRRFLNRKQTEAEMSDEMRFHIESRAEELSKAGLSHNDALRQSRIEFGSMEKRREEIRNALPGRILDGIFADLRYAIGLLRKNASFSVLAILTIALGIGAATATFSVVDTVLLRPLPYKAVDHLVNVWIKFPKQRENSAMQAVWDTGRLTQPDYLEWKAKQTVFDEVTAVDVHSATVVGRGDAQLVAVGDVDVNFFSMLGASMERGRSMGQDDGLPDAPRVAILSHAIWQHAFSGDPDVVGQTIDLDEATRTTYEVIGVLPQSFEFRFQPAGGIPDVWIPIRGGSRPTPVYTVIGRLKTNISIARAEEETDRIFQKLPFAIYKRLGPLFSEYGARLVPLQAQETANARTPLFILFAAAILLLVIACGNVASLLLGRAVVREHEIAMRSALGASRTRIFRQLVTESLLLAFAGSLAGIVLAYAGIRGLIWLIPPETPHIAAATLDLRVLFFMIASATSAGVCFVLLPALTLVRSDVGLALKDQTRRHASGKGHLQGLVIIGQISISFVLLVGAGLLTKSLFRLTAVDSGLQSSNLSTIEILLPRSRYRDAVRNGSFQTEALSRLRALPGVQETAAVSYAPFTGKHTVVQFDIDNVRLPEQQRVVEMRAISQDYFRAIGTPITEGRSFTDFEDAADPAVAVIVNQTIAKRFWPNESAINKRLRFANHLWSVVGVSSSVKEFGLGDDTPGMIYIPAGRIAGGPLSILVRSSLDLEQLAPSIRHEISSIDPDIAVERMAKMNDLIAASFANERYRTILISIFAISAGLLALIGLYGAMTRFVAYRTRELGIRIAVGATPANVLWLVLKHSAVLIVTGLAIGLFGALASARFISGLLFGVSPLDVSTYAGLSVALFVIALLASCRPAWHAANTDPIRALRVE